MAIENSELLQLDAIEGTAPAIWACLGTAEATLDTRRFYKSREAVMRSLKRRWPAVEYAALVEFTTGYAATSGGKRRPHWNLLLKGIPAEDVDQARDVICRVWCAREQARPEAQHVGTVTNAGGLMRYIAHHFQKESQRPPRGWKGHKLLHSRGYLWTATAAAREAARESLRAKRDLHSAERHGATGVELELDAAAARATRRATSWLCVNVTALALQRDWRIPRTDRRELRLHTHGHLRE